MTEYTLQDFSSCLRPRWSNLPEDDAMALLGYCFGRRQGIRRRFRTPREVFDAYRDMMLAVFCCGGSLHDLRIAGSDYSNLILDEELCRDCRTHDPRPFALYLEEALLVAFQMDGEGDRLTGLLDAVDATTTANAPHMDNRQQTKLKFLVELWRRNGVGARELGNAEAPRWLASIANGDSGRFTRTIVAELKSVAEEYSYVRTGEALSFLERTGNFRRFGSGYILSGAIQLATRSGVDCHRLKQVEAVKRFSILA